MSDSETWSTSFAGVIGVNEGEGMTAMTLNVG